MSIPTRSADGRDERFSSMQEIVPCGKLHMQVGSRLNMVESIAYGINAYRKAASASGHHQLHKSRLRCHRSTYVGDSPAVAVGYVLLAWSPSAYGRALPDLQGSADGDPAGRTASRCPTDAGI